MTIGEAEMPAQRGCPRLGGTVVDDVQQGHVSRCSTHGSSSCSTSDAAASASDTSRRDAGNTTFAQILSARLPCVPSDADSVCAIHRSTPFDGTATTSGVKGA